VIIFYILLPREVVLATSTFKKAKAVQSTQLGQTTERYNTTTTWKVLIKKYSKNMPIYAKLSVFTNPNVHAVFFGEVVFL